MHLATFSGTEAIVHCPGNNLLIFTQAERLFSSF